MLTGYWQERGEESKRSTLWGKTFLYNSCCCHHQAAVQVHSSELSAPLTTPLWGPLSHPDVAVLEEMSSVIYIVLSQKLLNHWVGQEQTLPMRWMNEAHTLLSTPWVILEAKWWFVVRITAFPAIKRKLYFRNFKGEHSLISSVEIYLGWLTLG